MISAAVVPNPPDGTRVVPPDRASRLVRALVSLEGLSIGDAFGGRFFMPPGPCRELPPAPWRFSDDTAMASALVSRLAADGKVDPDALAADFASAYLADPYRGYGLTTRRVLERIAEGIPWAEASRAVFDGRGSMGNGGAMRVAPLGGYFADDLDAAADQAEASARPTHAHPEGRAGAVAVAIAAAMAARGSSGHQILEAARDRTPPGMTRDGLVAAIEIGPSVEPAEAAALLGNGQKITAPDTVPFALWCAASRRGDFEASLWAAVSVGGDNDTLGAIVGGVAALAVGSIPERWTRSREPLHIPFHEEAMS